MIENRAPIVIFALRSKRSITQDPLIVTSERDFL